MDVIDDDAAEIFAGRVLDALADAEPPVRLHDGKWLTARC